MRKRDEPVTLESLLADTVRTPNGCYERRFHRNWFGYGMVRWCGSIWRAHREDRGSAGAVSNKKELGACEHKRTKGGYACGTGRVYD